MLHHMVLVALALTTQPGAPVKAWKAYGPARGEFTVALPAKPTEKKQKLKLPDGGTVDLAVVSYKRGSTHSYSAAAGAPEAAPEAPDAILDAARDDLVKALKGKLGGETPGKLGDVPARDVTIEIPNSVVAGGAVGRARLALAGPWLFEVVVMMPTAEARRSSATIDGFLASFKPSARLLAEAKANGKPGTPSARTATASASSSSSSGSGRASSNRSIPRPAGLGSDWRLLRSTQKGFAVYMPGTPRERTLTHSTMLGIQEQTTYEEQYGRVIYMVEVSPVPGGSKPGDEEGAFAVYKSHLLSMMRSTVKTEKKTSLEGHGGYEFVADLGGRPGTNLPEGALFEGRLYLAGPWQYTIAAIIPPGQTRPKEVDAFFSSFTILPTPKGKGSQTADGGPAWEKYTSAEGGFVVTFPGKVRPSRRPARRASCTTRTPSR